MNIPTNVSIADGALLPILDKSLISARDIIAIVKRGAIFPLQDFEAVILYFAIWSEIDHRILILEFTFHDSSRRVEITSVMTQKQVEEKLSIFPSAEILEAISVAHANDHNGEKNQITREMPTAYIFSACIQNMASHRQKWCNYEIPFRAHCAFRNSPRQLADVPTLRAEMKRFVTMNRRSGEELVSAHIRVGSLGVKQQVTIW